MKMPQNPTNHKNDEHYKKAKTEGYRARSAYKLIDIQNRYKIFKRVFYVLDIGSAPGSWLQVAKKYTERNLELYNDNHYHRDHYKIMGVDIKTVSPIEGIVTVKMNVSNPRFQDHLTDYFGRQKLDLMISDASIKKSGHKLHDQVRQIGLCQHVLDLAKTNLKQKGTLILKSFQGSEFDLFYHRTKKIFRIFKAYKPKSSKKQSNEIYLIGIDMK